MAATMRVSGASGIVGRSIVSQTIPDTYMKAGNLPSFASGDSFGSVTMVRSR